MDYTLEDCKFTIDELQKLEKEMSIDIEKIGLMLPRIFVCMQVESTPKVVIAAMKCVFISINEHKKKLRLPAYSKVPAGTKNIAFAEWVSHCYSQYISILLKKLESNKEVIRTAVLNFLIEHIFPSEGALWTLRQAPQFPLRLFERIVVSLLNIQGFYGPELRKRLLEEMINKYSDAYIHFCSTIFHWTQSKISLPILKYGCISRLEEKEKSLPSDTPSLASEKKNSTPNIQRPDKISARNALELLLALRVPSREANVHKTKKVGAGVKTLSSDSSSFPLFHEGLPVPSLQEERRLFSDVWTAFSKLPVLTDSIYRSLLSVVPVQVLPYLSSPLQFADFYMNAYDHSDEVLAYKTIISSASSPTLYNEESENLQGTNEDDILSPEKIQSHVAIRISALSGLFHLIGKYKMGDVHQISESCTGYFIRLYRCLEARSFVREKLAKSLISLLNISLNSSLLPINLRASFVKKMLRVALLVSGSNGIALVGIALGLLQKYKHGLRPLLDVSKLVAHSWRVAGDRHFQFNQDPKIVNISHVIGDLEKSQSKCAEVVKEEGERESRKRDREEVEKTVTETLSEEQIQAEVDFETALRHLTSMSLWEVRLLKIHVNNSISQLGDFFETDFMAPMAKPVMVQNTLETNDSELILNEMKIRIKNAPYTSLVPSGKLNDVQMIFEALS